MRKKIQKLTEEDLQRYERALQLWEIALRRQEAELMEREAELGVFYVPQAMSGGEITLGMLQDAYAETIRPRLGDESLAHRQTFQVSDSHIPDASVAWCEALYKLEDTRKHEDPPQK